MIYYDDLWCIPIANLYCRLVYQAFEKKRLKLWFFLFISYRSIMMRSTHCKISFNGSAHQQKDGRAHCHPKKDQKHHQRKKSNERCSRCCWWWSQKSILLLTLLPNERFCGNVKTCPILDQSPTEVRCISNDQGNQKSQDYPSKTPAAALCKNGKSRLKAIWVSTLEICFRNPIQQL